MAGTDAGFLNSLDYPALGLHQELALYVENGLNPAQALSAAPRAGPAWFGLLDRYGAIETGKQRWRTSRRLRPSTRSSCAGWSRIARSSTAAGGGAQEGGTLERRSVEVSIGNRTAPESACGRGRGPSVFVAVRTTPRDTTGPALA